MFPGFILSDFHDFPQRKKSTPSYSHLGYPVIVKTIVIP